ncbi:MAG: energy transducer TonB [Saprospiraceae bacterium]|nr:energy transducer TonB [Saprospiraceae bacterium]
MEKEKKQKHFLNQPSYPGGPKAITQFIYANLKYPDKALEAGVEGTVYLEAGIDHKGNIIETRVLQGIGHGCDEEAARVLRLLKFDVPKNRGVNVLFHKKFNIRFQKPVQKTVPAPQQNMQIQYTVTNTPAEPTAPAPTEPKPNMYTYTIKL